jgi:hypothetical protein
MRVSRFCGGQVFEPPRYFQRMNMSRFTEDNLPVEIVMGDGICIPVKEEVLSGGQLGCWDESEGDITITPDQPKVVKHIILIHEFLHVAESLLLGNGLIKRRTGEAFVTNAAPILLALLVNSGLYNGVTPDELAEMLSFVPAPSGY